MKSNRTTITAFTLSLISSTVAHANTYTFATGFGSPSALTNDTYDYEQVESIDAAGVKKFKPQWGTLNSISIHISETTHLTSIYNGEGHGEGSVGANWQILDGTTGPSASHYTTHSDLLYNGTEGEVEHSYTTDLTSTNSSFIGNGDYYFGIYTNLGIGMDYVEPGTTVSGQTMFSGTISVTYDFTPTASMSISSVPEPTSLLSLASLTSFFIHRRTRNKI